MSPGRACFSLTAWPPLIITPPPQGASETQGHRLSVSSPQASQGAPSRSDTGSSCATRTGAGASAPGHSRMLRNAGLAGSTGRRRTAPASGADGRREARPPGVPVSQHVVPDFLHQLEGPGQRGPEHVHGQEVPVPGRHRGLHEDLLDVGHRGSHVLRGDGAERPARSGRDTGRVQTERPPWGPRNSPATRKAPAGALGSLESHSPTHLPAEQGPQPDDPTPAGLNWVSHWDAATAAAKGALITGSV